MLDATDAPCFVVTEELAEEVTGFHVHRGALASLERRPLATVEEVLAGARTVLVLEDVVDHTNVGAIFRCGAAFGFDAVLLAPRCADPLYRRSIKVAMGAVFTLPWTRLPDWADALPSLRRLGLHHGRPDPGRDARPVEEAVAGARPGRPRPRLGGPRAVAALGGVRRPAGDHPDVGRGGLAQRRRRGRRRLLRDVDPRVADDLRNTVRVWSWSSRLTLLRVAGQDSGKSSAAFSIAFWSRLRALVGSRSPKTVPRVWSVSCCRQRASSPSPENSTGSPSSPVPVTVAKSGRAHSTNAPG